MTELAAVLATAFSLLDLKGAVRTALNGMWSALEVEVIGNAPAAVPDPSRDRPYQLSRSTERRTA